MRRNYSWKLARTSIELGCRTAIMGILNLTPDSFSDGGLYNAPEQALDRALEIEAEGADLLDIGGQSTRPLSSPLGASEEVRRVIPLLERIVSTIKIPVSIDTYHAEVARLAMTAGAQIINDISGLRMDPEMIKIARDTGAGVVLMHSRGNRDSIHDQKDGEGPETIREELIQTAAHAVSSGIAPEAIVVDPGIGFSKGRETSLKVLKRLDIFSTLGYPLLVGMSRKSFIKIDMPVSEAADWSTAAAVAMAVTGGARLVRVHDVAHMRVVVQVADSVLQVGSGEPD
jgi:dihydropteroate synthase